MKRSTKMMVESIEAILILASDGHFDHISSIYIERKRERYILRQMELTLWTTYVLVVLA